MRLSAEKAAHAVFSSAEWQESSVLRVFCEGWDATNLKPTVTYPALCEERKTWGTRSSVVATGSAFKGFLVAPLRESQADFRAGVAGP
jgi:hypothetical protein